MKKRRKPRRRKKQGTKRSLQALFALWKNTISAKKKNAPETSHPSPLVPNQSLSDSLLDAVSIEQKWYALQWKKSKEENTQIEKKHAHQLKIGRYSLIFLLIALIIGSPTAALVHLHHKSANLETDLKESIRLADWAAVHRNLALSNVTIYHILNPSLAYSVGDAESWIQRQKRSYAQLKAKIESIESGKTPLNNLSIHAIAEMERALRALPTDINDLSGRLSLQYANNRAAFSKNKNFVMEQLLTTQDINSFITLDVDKDCEILKSKINEWEDFLETCHAYEIPAHLAERGKRYLLALKQFHEEAHMLQDFKERIRNIIIYSELKNWNRDKQANKYPLTCSLLEFLGNLPTLEEWQSHMLPINQKIKPEKRNAAHKTLLSFGPSFSPQFPATQSQYSLAKELFQTPSLWRQIYQIIHTDGRTYLSEEYPKQKGSDKQYVFFNVSELDSHYTPNQTNTIYWDAKEVSVRRINCARFMQNCGISRDTFFSHANLPQLLEKISAYRDKECPTLAKAYVYDCVLTLLLSHPLFEHQIKHYSTKLAEDAESFSKLRIKHAKLMYVGAWLAPKSHIENAENDFAAWFKAHKNRNYNKEIADNAAPLFRATPQYIGYVDETRNVHLRKEHQKNNSIWYLSPNGISSTKQNQLPDEALPYSPLFIDSNLK